MEIKGKRINSNVYFRKPYDTWKNMMVRCYDKTNKYYKNYGAKGITVCERWKNFNNFLEDFDKIKGFSVDIFEKRKAYLDKDGKNINNKQYNLDNCEFIDITTSNKRKQHQMKPFKMINTITKSEKIYNNQSDCSRENNIPQGAISYALNKSKTKKYKEFSFEYIVL